MIDICKKILLVPLFGVMLTANASAVVVANNGTILTGTNGLINVTERSICGTGGCTVNQPANGVEYSLKILDPQSSLAISAFAISTNTPDINGGIVSSSRTGWIGIQIAAANWAPSPYGFLGSYGSFFGNDLYANFFMKFGGTAIAITTTSDALFEFFQLYGASASQFVAFNANGVVVDQSLRVNSVPEPAPLALLGLGLIGIGLLRKRRKS